eukprot:3339901-Prymnesium_polylepis.1
MPPARLRAVPSLPHPVRARPARGASAPPAAPAACASPPPAATPAPPPPRARRPPPARSPAPPPPSPEPAPRAPARGGWLSPYRARRAPGRAPGVAKKAGGGGQGRRSDLGRLGRAAGGGAACGQRLVVSVCEGWRAGVAAAAGLCGGCGGCGGCVAVCDGGVCHRLDRLLLQLLVEPLLRGEVVAEGAERRVVHRHDGLERLPLLLAKGVQQRLRSDARQTTPQAWRGRHQGAAAH